MDFSINWLATVPALVVLVGLAILDFCCGILAAGMDKNEGVASVYTYRGLVKKMGMFVVIAVGMLIDLLILNYQKQLDLSFRPPVTIGGVFALGFCVYEIISVLEKLKKAGVPMPPFAMKLLRRLRKAKVGGELLLPEVHIKLDSDLAADFAPKIEESKRKARRAAAKAEETKQRVDELYEKVDEVVQQQCENSGILKSISEELHNTSMPDTDTQTG